MKKNLLFIYLYFLTTMIIAQNSISPNASIDSAIDQLWGQQNNTTFYQSVGAESLGKDNDVIAPLIPPARPRQIPGTEQLIIPIEETDGPLNLAPNDTKAYILYNRATIAFRNKQYEIARELYRDLVRKYPESSYSPYALYVLSLSETDYRRKIRILLTIKERFPEFPYRDMILDRLGDIYYLLDSPEAAEEVLSLSQSPYALYIRSLIKMDAQKPNQAINLIRKYLRTKPNNEAAYQAYMLYAEALINIKGYKNALVILEKATELRSWAYDNGALILFNAGKALYHNKQYQEALYAFSLLRLRFARITESRIADQYLVALSKKNIVSMQSVPWLAKSFETVIKEQPIVEFRSPPIPSLEDILAINNLPKSAIEEPSLDGVTFLPPMPIPVPPKNTYSVLVPLIEDTETQVELITLTNMVYQEITNLIETFVTNRVFVVETNNITNNFTGIIYQTNMLTNIIQTWETNTVVSYEPVVLWRTNYTNINLTNLVTNIVDFVVTNEKIEINYLWKTNYNFVNRPQSITNEIIRYITNRYLEQYTNQPPQWKESIERKKYIEIVPGWKTTYNTLDTNQLVTNVIQEIKTNQRLELVPRWADNIRTNDGYKIVDTIITNTRLRIAPRWITNFQIIQTNMRDVVITNMVQTLQTNTTERIVTNLLNINHYNTNTITNLHEKEITNLLNVNNNYTNTITNLREKEITNLLNISNINIITNIVYHYATNFINIPYEDTNISTNIINKIITNYIDAPFNQTNVITNYINTIVTNYINNYLYKTNVSTNSFQDVITNVVMPPKGKQIFLTNLQEIVLTNNKDNIVYSTNYITNLRQIELTNNIHELIYNTNIITNLTELIITNTIHLTNGGELIITNLVNKIITNYIDKAFDKTNIITNLTDVVITNYVKVADHNTITITNIKDKIITNILNNSFNQTNMITNIVEQIITNVHPLSLDQNIVITNTIDKIISNTFNLPFENTNIATNIVNQVITNYINNPYNKTNVSTNLNTLIITNNIFITQGVLSAISNNIDVVLTNVFNKPLESTNIITNLIDKFITNTTFIPNSPAVVTNRLHRILTNVVYMPNGGVVLYTNSTERIETNFVNRPFDKTNVFTNYIQQIITNAWDNIGNNANIITNITEMIATNIIYIPYGGMDIRTNLQQNIITNRMNRPFTQTNISTNLIENIVTNLALIPKNSMNFMQISAKFSNIELAPMEQITIDDINTDDDEQIDLIEEPIYTVKITENQMQFISDEILQLENQVAKLTEKSAGIAGKYSFTDKKGFVIRIAQLKDLAVATIVLRDLNKLNIDAEIGVYYRDELYFIEIRSLESRERAQEISYILYENGYTDVQIFEQYEVIEYQDR